MSGFNQESTMPEKAGGGDETAVVTEERADAQQPSVQSTDRFGLERAGKGYLTRKYNIEISKAGQPYFAPIESLLSEFVLDAEAALTEGRARVAGDEDLRDKIAGLAPSTIAAFEAWCEYAGDDRIWLARKTIIWPLTDQLGFQLYNACSGEADLLDYATYLIRTDASVESVADLDSHVAYGKRTFWTDVAYNEVGLLDAIIGEADESSLDYNLGALLRAGYQSKASMDTKTHLRGVPGKAPGTEDVANEDIKSQILASRRVASQVA